MTQVQGTPLTPPFRPGTGVPTVFGFEMATNLQYLTINHWYCIPSRTKIEKTNTHNDSYHKIPPKNRSHQLHQKTNPGENLKSFDSQEVVIPDFQDLDGNIVKGHWVEAQLRSSWFQGVVEEKVNYWLISIMLNTRNLNASKFGWEILQTGKMFIEKHGLLMFHVDSLVCL